MNLLEELKLLAKSNEFIESKNYYYDYHICPVSDNKEKISLDFTLANDLTDEILRFGSCKKCGICIYHKDYHNNSF